MNVKYDNRHFKFQERKNTVYIDFDTEFFPSPHEYKDRRVTFCTISVYSPNNKVAHYHAGTVYNPHDVYNQRSGMFIAFRKALRQLWDEKHWRNPEHVWDAYHKHWAHFLAALIDGKVVEDADPTNPL